MKTFLLDIADRFRRFDEQLDVEHKEQSILQRLIEKESKRKKYCNSLLMNVYQGMSII